MEVKAHDFFEGTHWDYLAQRKHDMVLEPRESTARFLLNPDAPEYTTSHRYTNEYSSTGAQRVTDEGLAEKEILWNVFGIKFWYPVDAPQKGWVGPSLSTKDDNWDLTWDRSLSSSVSRTTTQARDT